MAFIRHLPNAQGRGAALRGEAARLAHPTYALRALLRRLRRIEQPRVLELGAAEGANLEFFTQHGFRVTVEDLVEALPRPPERRTTSRVRRAGAPPARSSLLESRRPEREAFDLVLLWDMLDLLSVEAAAGLVQELRSRLRPRGLVWALFDSSVRSAAPCLRRFRIVGEDSLEQRLRLDRPVLRFVHNNRDILAMFDGFEVVCSTFLRVGLREMLFGRAPASSV